MASSDDNPKKFFFDVYNFDQGMIKDIKRPSETEEEPEPEEPIEPPPPSFSEEELETAKQTAFDEGHAKGLEEANAAHDAHLQSVLEGVTLQMPALLQDDAARRSEYEQEALRLAYALFVKVAPTLAQRGELEAVSEAIIASLAQQGQGATVELRIHPDHCTAVQEALTAQSIDMAAVKIVDAPEIQAGACQLKWTDGGSRFDPHNVHDKILALFPEHIRNAPEGEVGTIDATPEPEKPPEKSSEKEDKIEDSPLGEECDIVSKDNGAPAPEEKAPQQEEQPDNEA